MNATLNVDLVFTNGLVDQAASLDAARTAISAYVVEHEVEQGVLKEATLSVLAAANGKRIAMKYLPGQVATVLNAQPENYDSLVEKATAFIKANLVGENSLLTTRKGPGGGVQVRTAADNTASSPVAAVADDTTVSQ